MLTIDFPRLADAATTDPEFRIVSRYWDAVVELQVGDRTTELIVTDGSLTVGPDSRRQRSRVAVRASEEDWEKLLRRLPPPGWVDVATSSGFAYEGEPTERAAYHGAVRRIVELMRTQLHGPAEAPRPSAPPDGDEEIVGRYVHLDVEGVTYRVYYEESGSTSGIPVLLQHTAGADGRQWRHLLADRDFHRDFRFIAYDLPYHGKSLPPWGVEWWKQDYMPTRAWTFELLTALSRALGLERPIFIGCSIGGLMAPVLAYERPDDFRAVIGINGGLLAEGEAPATPRDLTPLGYLLDVYFHPRVANDWKASGVHGFMAAGSSPAAQRETSWLYGSGAPPVFAGDLRSYMNEFRLTVDQLRTIDTTRIAVYLLTGEYDPFAVFGSAERLAGCIGGCHHEIIPGAGHFPHSENAESFKEALAPILGGIAGRAGASSASSM